jgi:hypothetical protein
MALHFENQYPATIYVAVLYSGTNDPCGAANSYFSKAGWYGVATGQTIIPNISQLDTDLRYAPANARCYVWAQQYAGSVGATFAGTAGYWYEVPNGAAFGQCLNDNTNCQQWVDFDDIEFEGFADVTVIFGPKAGQISVTRSSPPPPHSDHADFGDHGDHGDFWGGDDDDDDDDGDDDG